MSTVSPRLLDHRTDSDRADLIRSSRRENHSALCRDILLGAGFVVVALIAQCRLVSSHVVADDVVYLNIFITDFIIDDLQRIVAGERGVAIAVVAIFEEASAGRVMV